MFKGTAAFRFRFLILGAAAALALVAAPLTARAERAAAAPPMPLSFAKYGDVKVHYENRGTGKQAVVFVHCWSCNLSFWRHQVAALDGKVRTLTLDLPGFGRSDTPKGDLSMEYFAKAVDAVVKEAKVDKVVLVGHSMGTPVIRQYYRLYPRKVAGLVVVDGTLRAMTDDPKKIDEFLKKFESKTYKEDLSAFLDTMFVKETPQSVKDEVKTTMLAGSQEVGQKSMKAMFSDMSIWKEDKIKVPVLCIMARNPMWTDDYKAFVKKLAPRSEYKQVEGVGHFLQLEKPDEFNKLLVEFLQNQKFIAKPKA